MKTVYTIGYEGTDIDRFLGTLLAVGIDVIVDVRAVPQSRKKGFSKNTLQAHLEGSGINYVSMRELGDPKPGREAAKAGDYETFKAIYTAHIDQPEATEAVAKLAAYSQDKLVCLLCFERDPETCHRFIIGERLGTFGFQMFHLYGEDPARYLRNQDKLPHRGPYPTKKVRPDLRGEDK